MDFPPISEELAVWAAIDLANWGRRNNTAIGECSPYGGGYIACLAVIACLG